MALVQVATFSFVAIVHLLVGLWMSTGILVVSGQGLETSPILTTSGRVVGVSSGTSHAFYQIPYAEPPVGDLRWKDPIPVQPPLKDVNGSVNIPVQCYQVPQSAVLMSEDCLVLNIFVPLTVSFPVDSSTTKNLLPVMFFIEGELFKYGSGIASSTFDGRELARVTKTIVVTINYRLGPLGFLTLKEEGQEDIVGNQGLKDQRLAMAWVQSNIALFGGDKNKVTIFGSSSGAQSVMLHLVSPKSKDLFHASIQQSNPAIFAFYHLTHEAALRVSRRLIQALGCNGTNSTERDCLLQSLPGEIVSKVRPIEVLTGAAEGSHVYIEQTFFPVIDGADITDSPMNLFKSGQWNKDKNMIIGFNADESMDNQFYFPKGTDNVTEKVLQKFNDVAFGKEYGKTITKRYMQEYPPKEGGDYRAAFGRGLSHYHYDCANKLIARYAANTGQGSVYFYVNSHPVLFTFCVTEQFGDLRGCMFAFHLSELPYVFRKLPNPFLITQADRTVENQFSAYWGSFARTYSPSEILDSSTGNFTDWPTYQNSSTIDFPQWSYLEIKAPASQVGNGYNDDICNFWTSINYARNIPLPSTTAKTEVTTTSGQSTQHLSQIGVFVTLMFHTIMSLC